MAEQALYSQVPTHIHSFNGNPEEIAYQDLVQFQHE